MYEKDSDYLESTIALNKIHKQLGAIIKLLERIAQNQEPIKPQNVYHPTEVCRMAACANSVTFCMFAECQRWHTLLPSQEKTGIHSYCDRHELVKAGEPL